MALMYPVPHDHRKYGKGHHERVEATIRLALSTIPEADRRIVADLSCGNAIIPRRIVAPGGTLHLGDYAGVHDLHPGDVGYLGPIEETVDLLDGLVDVFVLSETLEHLDNPAAILTAISGKAEHLLLSTPLECWHDSNAEHLWAWDREGVEELAFNAGWTWDAFTSVNSRAWGEPYLYGIWVFS
jgi:hypothetical protein